MYVYLCSISLELGVHIALSILRGEINNYGEQANTSGTHKLGPYISMHVQLQRPTPVCICVTHTQKSLTEVQTQLAATAAGKANDGTE